MLATEIILKPLITEKVTFQADKHNRYAFAVHRRATKPQIRRAVEEIYRVRVLSVATMLRRGRLRRNRFGYWTTPEVKRAIVKIHPDDKIELF
jgi:large subunit ribosomal protein L23